MEGFVLETISTYAYVGMFLLLLACGFGLPMPEDVILFTSGYLCYKGIMALDVSIAVAMFGVLMGDSVIFFVGRKFGEGMRKGRLPWPFKKLFTPERLRKIWGWFGNHGNKIIFFGRFAPGMRAPTFAVAGSSGMGYSRFLFWDGLAAMISVPLFIWLAYNFGEELDSVKEFIVRSKIVLVIVILAVILYYVIRHFRKKQTV
ncbi:MAG: DedA family protein [Myxococcota bacterium]